MNLARFFQTKLNLKLNFKAMISFLGTLLFFYSFAHAELGQAFVLCKHDKTVRTLRVDAPDETHCQAVYTKQGVDQVIGASQSQSACESYIAGVQKKLETAKWNCREVKESRVSNLSGDQAQ